MASAADLVVNMVARTNRFTSGMKSARGELALFGGTVSKVTSLLGGLTAALGLGASLAAADQDIQAQRKLESVIRSTGGAAGFTADELKKMASDLQAVTNFGDEVTVSAAAVLATFTQIRGDVFKEALKSAQDLSSVLGTDLQSSVILIGKSLNDPIKGITALSRAGVSFTAQQKAQIKTMVESGNLLGAQRMILKELKTEFGGAAEAMASPLKQLKNNLGDIAEVIGKPLIDNLKPLSDAWIANKDTIESLIDNGLKPFIEAGQTTLAILTEIAQFIVSFVTPILEALKPLTGENGEAFRFLALVVASLVTVFTAYRLVLLATAAAKTVLLALSGPKGWAILAGAVVVATVAMNKYQKSLDNAAVSAKKPIAPKGDALARQVRNIANQGGAARGVGAAGGIPIDKEIERIRKQPLNLSILSDTERSDERSLSFMRLNVALRETGKLFAKGKITTFQYRSEVERLKGAFDKLTGGVKASIAAVERQIQVQLYGEDSVRRAELVKAGASQEDIDRLTKQQKILKELNATRQATLQAKEEGKGIAESLETPIERFRREQAKLQRIFDRGGLDPESFRRAQVKLRDETLAKLVSPEEEVKPVGPVSALQKGSAEAFSAIFGAQRGADAEQEQKKAAQQTAKNTADANKTLIQIREEIRKNASQTVELV